MDPDWPTKPFCLGEAPQKSSLEEMKKAWDGYYQYKGEELMKMKKGEMDRAIRDGTLQEWIDLGGSNRNAWYYYWINGKVPNPSGVSLEEAFDTSIQDEQLFKWIAIAFLIMAVGGVMVVLVVRKHQDPHQQSVSNF